MNKQLDKWFYGTCEMMVEPFDAVIGNRIVG